MKQFKRTRIQTTLLASMAMATVPFAMAQNEKTIAEPVGQSVETMQETEEGVMEAATDKPMEVDKSSDVEKAESEGTEPVDETNVAGESTEPVDETNVAGESTEPVEEPLVAENEGTPVEGQILLQSENTILADDLLGLPVYSPDDERVGEINDLIVSLDGKVDGVIIGVGGFLGIGEKEVAIQMQSLELIPQEGDDLRLVLSTTKDDLKAAPEFVSKYQQQAADEAATAQQNLNAAPVLAEPAPAASGN